MSTDKQRSLADYGATPTGDGSSAAEDDEPAQRPAWEPDSDSTRTCLNCGGHVPSDWGRVLGDQDGNAHGCLECHSIAEIAAGAAGDPEYEHYHDRGESYR